MNYRNAKKADLELLVKLRLDFVHVNEGHESYQMLRKSLFEYFEMTLAAENQKIILVENEGEVIGTGIIFYYMSVPSAFNISGKNGYITSMYVDERYRGRKIATNILEKLLNDARKRGVTCILLNASEMGKPLYYRSGFQDSKDGMYLKLAPF